jgi:hypothetical protein
MATTRTPPLKKARTPLAPNSTPWSTDWGSTRSACSPRLLSVYSSAKGRTDASSDRHPGVSPPRGARRDRGLARLSRLRLASCSRTTATQAHSHTTSTALTNKPPTVLASEPAAPDDETDCMRGTVAEPCHAPSWRPRRRKGRSQPMTQTAPAGGSGSAWSLRLGSRWPTFLRSAWPSSALSTP